MGDTCNFNEYLFQWTQVCFFVFSSITSQIQTETNVFLHPNSTAIVLSQTDLSSINPKRIHDTWIAVARHFKKDEFNSDTVFCTCECSGVDALQMPLQRNTFSFLATFASNSVRAVLKIPSFLNISIAALCTLRYFMS